MIIGVGTDLVKIDRIASVIARHGDRFINRCFAVEEQISARSAQHTPSPCQGEGRGGGQSRDVFFQSPTLTLPLRGGGDSAALSAIAPHYAKRWAAKEAVAKALGLGIDAGIYLRDIVVLKDARGAPRIELRGGAAQVMQDRCHPGAGRGDTEMVRDPGLRRDDSFRIHLSLSDDSGIALAFVVIEA